MAAGQPLQKRASAGAGLRFVRISNRLLDPGFFDASALDLKFRMLVVTNHEPCLPDREGHNTLLLSFTASAST